MPPAVSASDVAISSIVRLAVRTRGSRMIAMPFDTASMPVNVPPPSENARRKTSATPTEAERVQIVRRAPRRDRRRDLAGVAEVRRRPRRRSGSRG